MFRTLRARLWFSYAFMVLTALAVVGVVLILYLLRNPLLYRKTSLRVSAAAAALSTQPHPADQLQEVARALDVRVMLFDSDRRLVADTSVNQPVLPLPYNLLNLRPNGLERDLSGKPWFYSVQRLSDGTWLLIAAPRPKVAPLLALLTDELSGPFLWGGAIALLTSLVLAFVIARWIADPLEQIVVAARTVPSDNIPPVVERGPHEVRELAKAFNSMVRRVRAGRDAQRDFVANVSHELKTPLTSIQGFSQALMDGTAETPDARRQAAEIIFSEAGRMHRMAIDLLDLAKLDAGTAEFQNAQVDMRALLREICDKFQPMAAREQVLLRLVLPESMPPLSGDGDRLAQVFSNLIDNALKFTPEGGTVTIRATGDDKEIQVSVNDTGSGIPVGALPYIFDRFYRADAARAGGDNHGAGLGLAIAHEIVTAHGGRISVRSAEGRGTGFVVHLPLRGPG
jgi:two-component system, OmpR family, sensor kinase